MACAATEPGWAKAVAKATSSPEERERAIAAAAEAAIAAGDAVNAARERLDGLQESLDAALEAQQRHEASVAAIRAREQTMEAAERVLAAAEERLVAEAQQQEASRAKRIEAAEKRLAEAKAGLEAAEREERPDGPTADELAAKIERGEQVVVAAREYERLVRERSAAEERKLEAQIVWARWDAIVKLLAPTGIETELGGKARETFVGLLRQCEMLSGPIDLTDECQLLVTIGREEHPRSIEQLSKGERRSVGVAIQHALCQLTGFPLLVVDEVDCFDRRRRDAFVAVAEEVAGAYGGAVLGLATITREPPKPPSEPWVSIWLKPDGDVVTLGGNF